MKITILTLFPEIFAEIINSSIIKRAREKDKVKINLENIRLFSRDKHQTVDDRPFGGGVGMLLKIDVLYNAIQAVRINKGQSEIKERVILFDTSGKIFTQQKARKMSSYDHLILICGHYEGVDARINFFIDEKISLGNFILTGGELPAMAVTDAIVRILPGVLDKPQASQDESFSQKLELEAPQYTRPAEFMGFKVPEVLLSGDHKKIADWKQKNTSQK